MLKNAQCMMCINTCMGLDLKSFTINVNDSIGVKNLSETNRNKSKSINISVTGLNMEVNLLKSYSNQDLKSL